MEVSDVRLKPRDFALSDATADSSIADDLLGSRRCPVSCGAFCILRCRRCPWQSDPWNPLDMRDVWWFLKVHYLNKLIVPLLSCLALSYIMRWFISWRAVTVSPFLSWIERCKPSRTPKHARYTRECVDFMWFSCHGQRQLEDPVSESRWYTPRSALVLLLKDGGLTGMSRQRFTVPFAEGLYSTRSDLAVCLLHWPFAVNKCDSWNYHQTIPNIPTKTRLKSMNFSAKMHCFTNPSKTCTACSAPCSALCI